MKFAILSLVALPPILLFSAWISMQIKSLPPPRMLNEEEMRRALNRAVSIWQAYLKYLEAKDKT